MRFFSNIENNNSSETHWKYQPISVKVSGEIPESPIPEMSENVSLKNFASSTKFLIDDKLPCFISTSKFGRSQARLKLA